MSGAAWPEMPEMDEEFEALVADLRDASDASAPGFVIEDGELFVAREGYYFNLDCLVTAFPDLNGNTVMVGWDGVHSTAPLDAAVFVTALLNHRKSDPND